MIRLYSVAILILAAGLLSININKPFIGQHDWNGVVYGQEAKNFIRFGYLPLKFGATLATGDTLPDDRKFSTHYTPVLPILISFSYRLLGISEWSTRLVPAAASLASVLLVILLGKELISFRAGIIAGTLMTVTPMFIYYGKNPVHEVVLLPFALLAFYSYVRWRQAHIEKWWKFLLISAAAAMLIGWSGYYAAGLIAIHGFLAEKKFRTRFLVLPALMAGFFLTFLFYVSVFNPDVGSELRRAVTARMGEGGFGMTDFVVRELRYSINLFTATLLFLSTIWVFSVIPGLTRNLYKYLYRSRIESGMTGNTILILLGLFGVAHILIFRQAGYYHEYLLFPVLPFVVLAAAGVIYRAKLWIILIILALTAGERAGYAKALINSEYVSDIYEEGVEFAKDKRWETERIPEERDVYFIFYADRENI